MLYFAYGSNLDWDQMRKRCPSARFYCAAKLKRYRLEFTRKSKERQCGVADIVESTEDIVWGVVYKINEEDIGRLDKSEGFVPGRPEEQNSYMRKERHVYADGDDNRPVLVTAYVAVREKNPPLPSNEYKRLIICGARCWHLPTDYIRKLEAIETA